MFERDYLMKLILGYFKTIIIVIKRGEKEKDPEGAADTLEQAIGEATEIDGEVLLSLAPDSIASILQVSGTDPKVVNYVAHGLLLEEGGSTADLDSDAGAARFAVEVERAHDTAYYRDADVSARFDPDAPLMQNELHEQGRFGWQDGRA